MMWLSARCRAWSYDLCDLSSWFELRADPPQPWVARSKTDRVLHEVLLSYYKDAMESSTFLLDKATRAKQFEYVSGGQFGMSERKESKDKSG